MGSPISQHINKIIHLLDTIVVFNGSSLLQSNDLRSVHKCKLVDLTCHVQDDHVDWLKVIGMLYAVVIIEIDLDK